MTTAFSQGQVVNVMQRQWSGVNKQGGIARITRVNSDDTLAVSYIIGDHKESAVNTKFVEPWGGGLEMEGGRQSRSSSRSLRGARSVKAPKQFDETVGRAATVTTGHELPELPPRTPKFIAQQVKEMEKVIGRVEREDMYEMFRVNRDPINLLKAAVDAASSVEGQENLKNAADAGVMVGTTRGWMAPVRNRSPNQRRSTSPPRRFVPANAELTVGGWEHPAEKKRAASHGRGASSRKRSRKGADPPTSRRPSGDGEMDSLPPPQPSQSPPPTPSQVAKGTGQAPPQGVGNSTDCGETLSAQKNRQKQQQWPPINLHQIRERFVSGHYIPPPGAYLYRDDSTSGEGGSQPPPDSPAPSPIRACEVNTEKSSAKRSGATCKRSQKKHPVTPSAQEHPPAAPSAIAAPKFAAVTSSVVQEVITPRIARETSPPGELTEGKEPRVCEVALTRDAGRLAPAAKLTFDYEPLLDWEGLRADVAAMVNRMLRGAEEWRSEREAENGDGKGMECDDSSHDDFDEGIEEYVDKARRFLVVSEELVTRQLEKAEKERYALAVKRSVEDFTSQCQAAAMQGTLRTEPFPLRVYKEYLKEYKPASDLRGEDKEAIKRELKSSLKDGYLGQAYGYDDHGISEMWMQTYMGEASSEPQEGSTASAQKAGVGQLGDQAIRVQVNNLMETMCITVVDSVNNEMRGINKPPKVLPKYKVLATDGKTAVEVVETPPPDGSEKENNTVGKDTSSSRTSPAEALVNTTNNDEDASEESSGRAAQRQSSKKAVKKTGLELGGQLEERSVWGIDCYTRTNVEHVLDQTLGLSKKQSRLWIRKTLLPALNRQRGPRGVDMLPALRDLCKVIPDGETEAEKRESTQRSEEEEFDLGPKAEGEHLVAAQALLHVIEGLNSQSPVDRREPLASVYFHCHPKGTGVICKDNKGIEADTFVTEYLGELYPAWRWCEKMDAVEEAKLKHGLKPELPDFYNIILERPREDARGYGLLYVDAGNHVGNFSSSLSHSCNANCTTATAVRNGKLCVTLTTTRAVAEGEELTMDYGAITSCETEYNKAVCLCGSHLCRQSFMTFTGTRALHEVLRGLGPLMTFKTLIQSAADKPMNSDEADALNSHGFKSSALGDESPTWLKKFAAMQLRYVEYERRKLPPALLMASSAYTHQSADAEARAVMERRVQSLVDVLSSVYHFLQEQKTATELTVPRTPTTPSSASRRGRRGRRTGGGVGEPEAIEIFSELGSVGSVAAEEKKSDGDGDGDDGGVGYFAALAEKPPLKLLEDSEVIEALWHGKQSMMRRLVRRLEAVYNEKCVMDAADGSRDMEKEEVAREGTMELEQPPCGGGKKLGKGKGLAVRRDKAKAGGVAMLPRFESPVILRERILVWDQREQKCLTDDAPARDELLEFLSTRSNMEVYTGQGVPLGGIGEGGIRADTGEPRSSNDKILLWNAIEARRVPCKDLPRRDNLAVHITARPELFLYAGQDMLENEAWFGARVARGVADAYAVAMVLPTGDPNERIPLWHSVTKKMIAGKDAPTRRNIHRYLRTRPHLKLYTGQGTKLRLNADCSSRSPPRVESPVPQKPSSTPTGGGEGAPISPTPRSAALPRLPGFQPTEPVTGEHSNGLHDATPPSRTISPCFVWASRSDGAVPQGFATDPTVSAPCVLNPEHASGHANGIAAAAIRAAAANAAAGILAGTSGDVDDHGSQSNAAAGVLAGTSEGVDDHGSQSNAAAGVLAGTSGGVDDHGSQSNAAAGVLAGTFGGVNDHGTSGGVDDHGSQSNAAAGVLAGTSGGVDDHGSQSNAAAGVPAGTSGGVDDYGSQSNAAAGVLARTSGGVNDYGSQSNAAAGVPAGTSGGVDDHGSQSNAAAGVLAGTSGGVGDHGSQSPRPASPSVGVDVGTDEDPADERAESAVCALNAAAAATQEGQYLVTDSAKPNGWMARLQSGVDLEGWDATSPQPAPASPEAAAVAAVATVTAAAAGTATAAVFHRQHVNGGVLFPTPKNLHVPLRQQLLQRPLWGLHHGPPLSSMWMPPVTPRWDAPVSYPDTWQSQATAHARTGDGATSAYNEPPDNQQEYPAVSHHLAHDASLANHSEYDVYGGVSAWGVGFARHMTSWAMPLAPNMLRGAEVGENGGGAEGPLANAGESTFPSPRRGVNLAEIVDTLPPSGDTPADGTVNESGHESGSGAASSGNSDAYPNTFKTGSSKASGELGRSTEDSEITASSCSGAGSNVDSRKGVLGVRNREEVESPLGAGCQEPSNQKKQRGKTGGRLLRGRGGALLKKQRSRAGESASASSNSKKYSTLPSRERIASSQNDSSLPRPETKALDLTASNNMSKGSGFTVAATGGKAGGARANGYREREGKRRAKVTSVKRSAEAGAEGKILDVDSGKAAAHEATIGCDGSGAERQDCGVQREELHRIMAEGHPDDRVEMWDPTEEKVLVGKWAPQRKRLVFFCLQYPLYEFFVGQTPARDGGLQQQSQEQKQLQQKQQQKQLQQQQQQQQPRAGSAAISKAKADGDRDREGCRPLDREAWKAGQAVVGQINCLLETEDVPHRGVLKKLLLKVREMLLGLRPLPNARNGAAADVLLLLAHTKTFAMPTTYATVRGDPVQVLAKELGNNVPRAVLKRYQNEKKATAARAAASRGGTGSTRPAFAAAVLGDGANAPALDSHADADSRATVSSAESTAQDSETQEARDSAVQVPGKRKFTADKKGDGGSLSPGDNQEEGEEGEVESEEDPNDVGTRSATTPAASRGGRGRKSVATRDLGVSTAREGPVASEGCEELDGVKGSGGASLRPAIGSCRGAKGKKVVKAKRGRGRPRKIALPRPPPKPPGPKPELFLKGNEVVHEYTPLSGPHYVLAQLLQWHNHGEGGNPNEPFDDKLRAACAFPTSWRPTRGPAPTRATNACC